jgi:hypothetical protein
LRPTWATQQNHQKTRQEKEAGRKKKEVKKISKK